MKKILGSLLLFTVFLVACSNSPTGGTSERPGTPTVAVEAEVASKESPLVLDKENRTLSVFATVNGKYLLEPTRHGMNFEEGKYGDEAIFKAFANPLDFHDALLELGAEAGNNIGSHSEDTVIKGQSLDISVTWKAADKDYNINDVIVDSTGTPLDFKFGGNFENAVEAFTGCLMCLDSCSVGISSNSGQEVGAFRKGDVEFRGNKDILPNDSTPVIVTFTIID